MFNRMVSKLGSQRPESIHCSVQTSGMWKTKLEYDQYISNISLTNDIESSWARKKHSCHKAEAHKHNSSIKIGQKRTWLIIQGSDNNAVIKMFAKQVISLFYIKLTNTSCSLQYIC